ncbi:MAG: DM13 domain-containing protein [Mycobacterium sp.]
MRFKTLTGTALLGGALALAACNAPSHDAQPSQAMTSQAMTSQAMPQAMSAQRTGMFSGLNDKKVSGKVTVAGGQVSLADFSSDKGPDLHIYLAKGSDEQAVSTGKELGTVAFDKGSQTFEVSEADAAMYDTVVINCDKAKEIFGAARLA